MGGEGEGRVSASAAAVYLSLIAGGKRQAELRGGFEEHSDEGDVFTRAVVQCSKLGGKDTLAGFQR